MHSIALTTTYATTSKWFKSNWCVLSFTDRLSGLSVILFYSQSIVASKLVQQKNKFLSVTFSILFPLGVDKLAKVIISLPTTKKKMKSGHYISMKKSCMMICDKQKICLCPDEQL